MSSQTSTEAKKLDPNETILIQLSRKEAQKLLDDIQASHTSFFDQNTISQIANSIQGMKIPFCLNDGHPIYPPAKPVFAPNRRKRSGEFGFFPYNFCSVSCAKAFLATRYQYAPILTTWLTLYAKMKLGIQGNIPCAPDQPTINVYRNDDQGITIEDYRRFENSHLFVERMDMHPTINRQVWQDEEQQNSTKSFVEIIRAQNTLAERLFKDFQETGGVIPKTLLNNKLKTAQLMNGHVHMDAVLSADEKEEHDEESKHENIGNPTKEESETSDKSLQVSETQYAEEQSPKKDIVDQSSDDDEPTPKIVSKRSRVENATHKNHKKFKKDQSQEHATENVD